MASGLYGPFDILECRTHVCSQILRILSDMVKYCPLSYDLFEEHGVVKNFIRHPRPAYAYHAVHQVNLDALHQLFMQTLKHISLFAERPDRAVREIMHEGSGEDFWAGAQFAPEISCDDVRSLDAGAFTRSLSWKRSRAQELKRKQEACLVSFPLCKAAI